MFHWFSCKFMITTSTAWGAVFPHHCKRITPYIAAKHRIHDLTAGKQCLAPRTLQMRSWTTYQLNSFQKATKYIVNTRRCYHSSTPAAVGIAVPTSYEAKEAHVGLKLDRSILLGMLDIYHDDGPTLIDHIPSIEHIPTATKPLQNTQDTGYEGAEDQARADEFRMKVYDHNIPLDNLFSIYRGLPRPNILYVDHESRSLMLRRLCIPSEKNEKSMLRYLSVLEDMKQAALPISLQQWNSAVHLAGRSFQKVTQQEVEAALRMWKEMEQQAGVTGNVVTFNILFDVATKAGQFVLADMIMAEMRNRDISLNRFSYVSVIYYHGLREDGAGIRQAYKALVEAGQIVNSSVLNCVIASLLRASEFPAAMNVYGRMKSLYTSKSRGRLGRYNRRASRNIGRSLNLLAKKYHGCDAVIQHVQDDQSLAPDIHTYVTLVQHHVTRTGDLQVIASLLDEMHDMGVLLHGRLFLELFKGFFMHGNKPHTAWTQQRLQDVWSAFQVSVETGAPNVYVAKWMCIWVLRAFEKCCGRARAIQVWEELKGGCELNDPSMVFFEGDPVGKALRYGDKL